MECYCYLRNVQDFSLDWTTLHELRCGETFCAPVIPCGSLVEYHPILHETRQDSISLVQRSFQTSSLVMCCMQGDIWKGDISRGR